MYYPLLSIALGSVLGAWLRWLLGLKLNPIYPKFRWVLLLLIWPVALLLVLRWLILLIVI